MGIDLNHSKKKLLIGVNERGREKNKDLFFCRLFIDFMLF